LGTLLNVLKNGVTFSVKSFFFTFKAASNCSIFCASVFNEAIKLASVAEKKLLISGVYFR